MKVSIITFFLFWILAFSFEVCGQERYVFFLHGRFLEEHDLHERHPAYGRFEFEEIIEQFEEEGFVVISEIRPKNTNSRAYALKVNQQIDSLLMQGVLPGNITVIGTSRGGYIAQYVSTFAKNPALNFVFIGCYMDTDVESIPEINFCGNVLTIFEKSDGYGVSAIRRKETSKLPITQFKEIELHTKLKHGFLFKPLKEWMGPSIQWAKQQYELN